MRLLTIIAVLVLTGCSGPGTVTEPTNYYAFVEAFTFSYWGYASAIAVVMVPASSVKPLTEHEILQVRSLSSTSSRETEQ